jgi:hypothetical protein
MTKLIKFLIEFAKLSRKMHLQKLLRTFVCQFYHLFVLKHTDSQEQTLVNLILTPTVRF